MTYRELLNTDDWKLKRQEILIRDNHTCKRCGISKENKFSGMMYTCKKNILDEFNIKFLKNEHLETKLVELEGINRNINILCKTEIYNSEIITNRQYVIMVNFADKNVIKYPFNGSTINNLKENIFLKNRTNEIFNNIFNTIINKQSKNKNLVVDLEAIWLIEYGIEHMASKNCHNLHIHHKCYRKDIEIWNQNDEEYDTLCSICHQIVHQNQLIPFYDKYGNIIQYLKNCKKCNGTGYLPQFKNIFNGTCFDCNGFGLDYNFENIL